MIPKPSNFVPLGKECPQGHLFLLLRFSGYSVSIDAFCALSERRMY